MKRSMSRTEGLALARHNSSHLCLHADSKRIRTAKTCVYNYQCGHCPFDQWLDEMEEGQEVGEDSKKTKNSLARAA